MKTNKKVALVIATLNQEEALREFLDSIKGTTYKNYKIFFTDDSGIGIGKGIKRDYKYIELITTKGYSGGSVVWNIGIRKALEWNADYILILDDDMNVLDKNWLSELVKVGESDEKIGMIGCKLVYPDGSVQHMGGYMKGWKITTELDEEKKDVFEVDHIMGCFMLIKRSVIDKVGLVDEIFNPYLLEETDFCLRTKNQGFKIVTVPYVKTIHKKSKTINTLPNSQRMFVRFKNDIIFSKRHLKFSDKLFRIFIYLPLVAIFRKQKDTDELKFKNFKLRKEFLINLMLLVGAAFYTIGKK